MIGGAVGGVGAGFGSHVASDFGAGLTIAGNIAGIVIKIMDWQAKKEKGEDFLAGVTKLGVRLLATQSSNAEASRLIVKYHRTLDSDKDGLVKLAKDADALLAFRTLYGGIEAIYNEIEWELNSLWQDVQKNAKRSSITSTSDPKHIQSLVNGP